MTCTREFIARGIDSHELLHTAGAHDNLCLLFVQVTRAEAEPVLEQFILRQWRRSDFQKNNIMHITGQYQLIYSLWYFILKLYYLFWCVCVRCGVCVCLIMYYTLGATLISCSYLCFRYDLIFQFECWTVFRERAREREREWWWGRRKMMRMKMRRGRRTEYVATRLFTWQYQRQRSPPLNSLDSMTLCTDPLNRPKVGFPDNGWLRAALSWSIHFP